jgi:hypothetical protein
MFLPLSALFLFHLFNDAVSSSDYIVSNDVMKMAVFWVVAPCSLVEVYWHFRGACCLYHCSLLWWWRQQAPLKWQQTSTRLHSATAQKEAIFILTAVRTWNPTKWYDDQQIINWKGCERKWSWHNLRYYPSTCLDGLRKTAKSLDQDSQSPGQYLNQRPPKYKTGVLATWSWCSVPAL